jgi:hypothetical protein
MLAYMPQTQCQKYTSRNWSDEEDTKLKEVAELVKEQHGYLNWKNIATLMLGKTAKQCRERFINQIGPDVDKSWMTPEEWNIIVEAREKFGNRWVEIAKLLSRRTPNWVKNQWNAMIRRSIANARDVVPKFTRVAKVETNRNKRKRIESTSSDDDDGEGDNDEDRTYEHPAGQMAEDMFSESFQSARKRTKIAETDELVPSPPQEMDEDSSQEESSLFEELVNASCEAHLQEQHLTTTHAVT